MVLLLSSCKGCLRTNSIAAGLCDSDPNSGKELREVGLNTFATDVSSVASGHHFPKEP